MSLSENALELCSLSRAELEAQFHQARRIDVYRVEACEYRGVSLGLPSWAEFFSWKKFSKTFQRNHDGELYGYNTRIVDDGLNSPWRAKLKRNQVQRFGHFKLVDEQGELVLDYSQGSKGVSPIRLLRDPLRAIDEEGKLLLGRSLLQLSMSRRVSTPSFFLLER